MVMEMSVFWILEVNGRCCLLRADVFLVLFFDP
jgi:hypothetical protein